MARTTRRYFRILASTLLLLAPSSVLVAGPEYSMGPETSIDASAGPHAVAGRPGSIAVARIESSGDLSTLWVSLLENDGRKSTHLIGAAVDPGTRPLLAAVPGSIVVAWRGNESWLASHLGRYDDSGEIEITHLPLEEGRLPLAVAVSETTDEVLMFLAPAIPDSSTPSSLVAVDAMTGTVRELNSFPTTITQAALRRSEERIHVAVLDRTSGDLELMKLDTDGTARATRRLNTFPADQLAGLAVDPSGIVTVAFLEQRPDHRAAVLARIDGTVLTSADLSSPGEEAGGLMLAGGTGRLAAWAEGREISTFSIVSLADEGAPSCRVDRIEPTRDAVGWLVGDPAGALLFREKATEDGETALSVRSLACGMPTAGTDEREQAAMDGTESTRAGFDEPCDGIDNDHDGSLDEGCDRACDNPGLAGEPLEITHISSNTDLPSMVWTGSEYGVAWNDFRYGNSEIFFVRLDRDGQVLGSELRVTNQSAGQTAASLVWTGSEYGLAWSDYRNGNNDIYFARINAAGVKLTIDIQITSQPGTHEVQPSLAWTGGEYGLAWADSRHGPTHHEIYYARLNSAGVKQTGDVRITNATLDSLDPELVWADGEFGLAWADYRTMAWELYFTRLNTAGTTLIGAQNISNDVYVSRHPSMVWNGSAYGLAWNDTGWTHFTWLNSAGANQGSNEKISSDGPFWPTLPTLAWTGEEWAVAWYAGDTDRNLFFARVDTSGHRIGSDVALTTGGDTHVDPALAWNGTDFGLAWTGDLGSHVSLLFSSVRCCDDADGDGYTECEEVDDGNPWAYPDAVEACDGRDNDGDGEIDEDCDVTCDNPENGSGGQRVTDHSQTSETPSLAWTGDGYGVAWADLYHGNWEIHFARLDEVGSLVPASEVRITTDTGDSRRPSLVWNGTEFGLAWDDDRSGTDTNSEIYFRRIAADGTLPGSEIKLTNAPHGSDDTSLVWTGSGYGLAWQDYRNSNWDIYFMRLDPEGNKLTGDVQLTEVPEHVAGASLDWTGSEYGLAWRDKRDGNWEIYFTRIDDLGSEIGSEVRITNDTVYSAGQVLVWNGTDYGLAWNDVEYDEWEIQFARLSPTGSVVNQRTVTVNDTANSWYATLAWSGSEYGIAWRDSRDSSDEIYFARLDTSGDTIGGEVRVTTHTGGSQAPSIVWNGVGFGVAWQDYRDGNWEIYAARIDCCDDADGDGISECDGDGNDADPTIYPGATESCDGRDNDADGSLDEGCDRYCDNPENLYADERVTSFSSASDYPDVAWTGSEYGVVWEDDRDGNSEIYFARLSAAGQLVPGSEVRVTEYPGASIRPAVAWNGTHFSIVWSDDRDGNPEIYFARLWGNGARDGGGVRVTSDPADSNRPRLDWSGSEYGLVWEDGRVGSWEIFFARLGSSGSRIGTARQVSYSDPANSVAPDIAWTGSEYGTVWRDKRDGNWEIYFQRLDSTGRAVGTNVRLSNDAGYSSEPALAWSENAFGEYEVCWFDARDGNWEVFGSRIDETGAPVFPEERVSIVDSHDSMYCSITWTGAEFGVAWYDDRDGNDEIYFARLDGKGEKIEDEVRITQNGAGSRYPRLVWNGQRHGVTWHDFRDGNWEIYFASIECCDDEDQDDWTECDNDCDDTDSSINPGADELCNHIDDNCNGATDEDFFEPDTVSGLTIGADRSTLSWGVAAGADRYDVVVGSLNDLLDWRGEFETSVEGCVENDSFDASAWHGTDPDPGEGLFFIVRGIDDCVPGSFDTAGPGQVADRDVGTEASGLSCN